MNYAVERAAAREAQLGEPISAKPRGAAHHVPPTHISENARRRSSENARNATTPSLATPRQTGSHGRPCPENAICDLGLRSVGSRRGLDFGKHALGIGSAARLAQDTSPASRNITKQRIFSEAASNIARMAGEETHVYV